MADCSKDLKQWWPILKPAHMKRLILITYGQWEKGKRKNPWSYPEIHTTDNTTKPKTTSFFPLWKLEGNQPVSKRATMHLAHLEEESTKREEEDKTEDPDGIDRVMEEFMVHLAWAVKDVEEKHCYHCSSPKHLICDCPLVRASKENMQLNCKEGTALRKGAQTPQMKMTMSRNPQEEVPKV